jgi:hypothetical protein
MADRHEVHLDGAERLRAIGAGELVEQAGARA